jgi:hypothetical protein
MTEAAPQTEDSTASMEDQAAAVAEAAEAAAAAKGAKVADKLVHQVGLQQVRCCEALAGTCVSGQLTADRFERWRAESAHAPPNPISAAEGSPAPSVGVYAASAQVEFYFSDENLPTDTFMIKQVTSNVEGWGECLQARRTTLSPSWPHTTCIRRSSLFILIFSRLADLWMGVRGGLSVGVNVICQFKKVKNMKLKLSKVVEILRTSIQLVRTCQRHGCLTQACWSVIRFPRRLHAHSGCWVPCRR